MFLKILAHPVFPSLNFHMPMVVDLSHPLVMLQGENGSGKSTLLHSIHYALKGEKVEGYVYRLEPGEVQIGRSYLFDAEQHNPRTQLELFKNQPEMLEFLRIASHGQVMLSLFSESIGFNPSQGFFGQAYRNVLVYHEADSAVADDLLLVLFEEIDCMFDFQGELVGF